jgi:hypothetical protein
VRLPNLNCSVVSRNYQDPKTDDQKAFPAFCFQRAKRNFFRLTSFLHDKYFQFTLADGTNEHALIQIEFNRHGKDTSRRR